MDELNLLSPSSDEEWLAVCSNAKQFEGTQDCLINVHLKDQTDELWTL